MNQPTDKHREEAREIRLPFPCGCLDAHTGGGMAVKEHICETHRVIASALSSRDVEVREVLEGLMINAGCWCRVDREGHTATCLATQRLWSRLQS